MTSCCNIYTFKSCNTWTFSLPTCAVLRHKTNFKIQGPSNKNSLYQILVAQIQCAKILEHKLPSAEHYSLVYRRYKLSSTTEFLCMSQVSNELMSNSIECIYCTFRVAGTIICEIDFSRIIHFCSKQIPVHAVVFLVIVLTCFAFDEINRKSYAVGLWKIS